MANRNEYMAAYMLARYHRRRAALVEMLGGKCMVCGSTENLELDHVDRKTKRHNMSKILASASEATYLAEAKLCQLLCRTHHENKSAAENSVEHGGGITGKKNCLCDLCRPLKNAYARKFKQAKRDKAKQAPVAEMD